MLELHPVLGHVGLQTEEHSVQEACHPLFELRQLADLLSQLKLAKLHGLFDKAGQELLLLGPDELDWTAQQNVHYFLLLLQHMIHEQTAHSSEIVHLL